MPVDMRTLIDTVTLNEHMEESPERDPLSDYKAKAVQGLYHYNHYEHPDGSWLQVWQGKPKHFIHSDVTGKQRKFDNAEAMKAHVRASHGASPPPHAQG